MFLEKEDRIGGNGVLPQSPLWVKQLRRLQQPRAPKRHAFADVIERAETWARIVADWGVQSHLGRDDRIALMELLPKLSETCVQLARLALAGRIDVDQDLTPALARRVHAAAEKASVEGLETDNEAED